MYCLRCGNETIDEQVFCENCLEVMEKYPVKSGTPVKIPHRESHPVVKKQSRRKTASLEDQIQRLKVLSRTLFALLGTSIVIAIIFAILYFGSL